MLMSASEIPTASWIASGAPAWPMAWNARIMPIVVPSRPTIVPMEAIVESAIRLRSSRGISRAFASSMAACVSSITSSFVRRAVLKRAKRSRPAPTTFAMDPAPAGGRPDASAQLAGVDRLLQARVKPADVTPSLRPLR